MIFSNKDRILVIAAHPDDETLGCGATLYKAFKYKAKLKVLFLGEGVSARFKMGDENSHQSLKSKKIRENECKKALDVLRVKDYKFGNRHCTKFDKYVFSEFVIEIEKIVNSFKPNIIFTHNNRDLNIDHNIVHRAVMTATRPINKNYLKYIYSFEVPCSSNWIFDKKFDPNVFVNITDYLEIKQKAFSMYKNENRKFPFPRSRIGIDTVAKFRGIQSGLKYAEAFKLERAIYFS